MKKNDETFIIVDGQRVHISWLKDIFIDEYDTEFEEIKEEE